MTNHIDDEELDETEGQDDEDQDPMESPLAVEFDTHCKEVGKLIQAKLDEANKALQEAEKIADEHGVPFRSDISPLSNSYVPAGFSKTKFGKLDTEVVCEIAGVWGEYLSEMFGSYGGGGWLHSAVC